MYAVASPDPDPNPRGGSQLPNPNECHSMLTSAIRGIYPYPLYLYIYIYCLGIEYDFKYSLTESWIIHVNNPWLNYGWLWSHR